MAWRPRKASPVFRFFENLVDPYAPYKETDTPPQRMWPFMLAYSQPFKRLFAVTGVLSVVTAAIELWLIWYMGRFVDLLSTSTPAEILASHSTELILVVLFLVFLRPILGGLDVILLNNTLLPNFGTLIRWRAHRQVLRQSVGWFENDFAGRIANRVVQMPAATGDLAFQVMDALAFTVAYMVGAAFLLANAALWWTAIPTSNR